MFRSFSKFSARVAALSLLIYRIVGIFIYFVGTRIFGLELIQKVWSLLVMFLIFIGGIAIKQTFIESTDNSVGKINDILKFCCVTASAYIAIGESLWGVGKVNRFLRKIELFDDECKRLKVNFESFNQKGTKIYAIQVLVVIIMSIISELLIVFNIEWIEFWKGNILPSLVCRFHLLQYIFFLHMIQSKVEILRSELANIVADSKNHLFSRDKTAYEKVLTHLQTLKTSHGILWSATFELNDMFTWSLTANLIQIFVQVGCDSYWAYLSLSLCNELLTCFRHSVLFFSQIIVPAILIMMMLQGATKIQVEASKFPTQFHQIRKRKHDVELYEMVSSLQNDN